MEFGSDFHLLDYTKGDSFQKYFADANLYGSGRQALMALAIARNWKKIWVPSYFCGESLNNLKKNGINLKFYNYHPLQSFTDTFKNIPLEEGDAILVVNYFGLGLPSNYNLDGVEIIEDHTHDLIAGVTRPPSAEWCIASLRKTLPIADGGVLWSPKNLPLPLESLFNENTENIIDRRYKAMRMKRDYLLGEDIDKSEYLREFNETEELFDSFPISAINRESEKILNQFDIDEWYDKKRRNYEILKNEIILPKGVKLLYNSLENKGTIFSFCLLFDSKEKRDSVRELLIKNSIYPAILWTIRDNNDLEAKDFGDRMLSIHCDGRYTVVQIKTLSEKLNRILNND